MMHVVSTFFYHDCLNVPPTANNQTVVVDSMKQLPSYSLSYSYPREVGSAEVSTEKL